MKAQREFAVVPGVQVPAREAEVLACAARGMTDKQIAAALGISKDTVSTYWRRILHRHNASSRTEVVARVTEGELAKKLDSAEDQISRLREELREHSMAQARELAHRNLLAAVTDALLNCAPDGPGVERAFEELTTELLVLTSSKLGYLVEADTAGGRTVWKPVAHAKQDQSDLALTEEQIAAVCDRVLGRSSSLPGFIHSVLTLPIHFGEELLGAICIANRPGGYPGEFVEYLEPLVATCGTLIAGLRNDRKRRDAERQNAETLARLQVLLNSLDSAVLFVDETRRVCYVNALFCENFTPGFQPDEIIGMNAPTLYREFKKQFKHPEEYLAHLEELVVAASPVRSEPIQMEDGRLFLRDFDKVRVGKEAVGHVWKFREVLAARFQA